MSELTYRERMILNMMKDELPKASDDFLKISYIRLNKELKKRKLLKSGEKHK